MYRGLISLMPKAQPLLLDLYPNASVAYSLRKLRTAYTGDCIRVRRSSDNAEQNIGFVNNVLDTASLLSFVGAGDGFVTRVYSQVGSLDIRKSTALQQYRIVTSGVVETNNSKPTIRTRIGTTNFEGYRLFDSTTNVATTQTFKTAFYVAQVQEQLTVNYIVRTEQAPLGGLFMNGSAAGVNGLGAFVDPTIYSLTGEDLNRHLGFASRSAGRGLFARDGAATSDLGALGTDFTIQSIAGIETGAPATRLAGNFQEVILFSTDEVANKTAIETNINNFYNIYP